MAEKEQEFVVTDRRKYRMEGDDVTANPEHTADPEPPAAAAANEAPKAEAAVAPEAPSAEPQAAEHYADRGAEDEFAVGDAQQDMPPLTAEQAEAGERAYRTATERLDDVARANDLTGRRDPPVSFERLVQSLYTSALVQLGLIGVPGQQQVRVDPLGARQTIDMLGVIKEKTVGNISADETKLIDSALFELRMAFLETMQLIAQQAQKQQQAAGGAAPGNVTPFPGSGGAPRR